MLTAAAVREVTHGRIGIGVVTGDDRSDFDRGRVAAAHALAELGTRAKDIAARADGAPVWPPGFVGSIAHTRGAAIAIVASADDFVAVGVDIEPAERVTEEATRRRIGTEEELASLPEPALLILFCAKEATYKALAPLGAPKLGFLDVFFERSTPGLLVGHVLDESLGRRVPRTVFARYAVAEGYVVAAVQIERYVAAGG